MRKMRIEIGVFTETPPQRSLNLMNLQRQNLESSLLQSALGPPGLLLLDVEVINWVEGVRSSRSLAPTWNPWIVLVRVLVLVLVRVLVPAPRLRTRHRESTARPMSVVAVVDFPVMLLLSFARSLLGGCPSWAALPRCRWRIRDRI